MDSGKAAGSGQGTAAFEGEAVAPKGSRLNVELLRRVRDAIADEANPTGFDMSCFFLREGFVDFHSTAGYGTCGTAACIAGHAAAISQEPARGSYDDIEMRARRALGLDREAACYLFYGNWSHVIHDEDESPGLERITRAEALAYLDRCIAAGEIVR